MPSSGTGTPSGVADIRHYAEDEYGCLIEPIMSLLLKGTQTQQLTAYLNTFVPDHFGLTPYADEVATFADKVTTWWATSRTAT